MSFRCKWALFFLLIAHVLFGWYIAIPLLNSTDYKKQFRISAKSREHGNFTLDYEVSRRDAQRFYQEQWREMKVLMKKHSVFNNKYSITMREHYIENMVRHERMREMDGFDKNRFEYSQELSNFVQDHIAKSQNPRDCKNPRVLVCYFNSSRNGWACMVHHMIYCLMAAFASQRLLVLDKAEEMFGFDSHFLPVSQTCQFNLTTPVDAIKHSWPKDDSQRVVKFCPNKKNPNDIIALDQYEEMMFPYLPSQILERMMLISPDPPVWFVGQFGKYLLRPQPWFSKEMTAEKKSQPGVAIQVRRQDKFRESKFIPLDKYVEMVEEYFDIQETKKKVDHGSRSVFVATDEPAVLVTLNKEYPRYNWIGDESAAQASVLENRYTEEGQDAIIRDIFKLAQSDFLVCTFSSNVCRLAYEVRMASRPFVANLYEVVTLDMDYFFQYGNSINYLAISNFQANAEADSNQLSFNKGDVIYVAACFLHCKTPHNTGLNNRTSQSGHFMRSKVKRLYRTSMKFPFPPFISKFDPNDEKVLK